jgi:hypothetical protein
MGFLHEWIETHLVRKKIKLPTFMKPTKIISGGQTGADRAGLDFAIKHGMPHGGYCPKDRRAEDGVVPFHYQLTQTPSGNYVQRTEWNVRDSDGTVIFSIFSDLSGGSLQTFDFANIHVKPCLHLHPALGSLKMLADELVEFLITHKIEVLNVAGSRASKEPQVYSFAQDVMELAFENRLLDS